MSRVSVCFQDKNVVTIFIDFTQIVAGKSPMVTGVIMQGKPRRSCCQQKCSAASQYFIHTENGTMPIEGVFQHFCSNNNMKVTLTKGYFKPFSVYNNVNPRPRSHITCYILLALNKEIAYTTIDVICTHFENPPVIHTGNIITNEFSNSGMHFILVLGEFLLFVL